MSVKTAYHAKNVVKKKQIQKDKLQHFIFVAKVIKFIFAPRKFVI